MFDSPELKNLSRYVRTYLGGLKTLCVEVDKQEWKYLEGGRGETVVFLHGAVGSKTQWRSLMQEYLQDYRVIAIDVPGLCVSQTFRFRKHSFRQYGVWLNKVLAGMRLGKIHLVGASMGSAIAAYYAANHPDQVESLTLLGFPTNVLEPGGDHSQALRDLLDVDRIRTAEDLQQAYNASFYNAPSIPRIVLNYNLREFRKHQGSLKSVLTDIVESFPVMIAGLRQIRMPTLIVHGEEDRVCPVLDAEVWQRHLPHAQYHLLAECGHVIHLEKTDAIAPLHKEFLLTSRQQARAQQGTEEETGRFAIIE